MKRNIFMMAAVALLAMACTKEQQPASENPFDFNEGVTEIRVTVPTTKAAIAEQTGVCTWQNGDKIAIFFASEIDPETDKPTAGTRLEFTYNGLYEDGSAKFVTTETVPKSFVRANAAYPAAALNDKGAQSLIRDYVYSTDSVPVYLVGSVNVNEGALSAHLTYNASIMKFTLHDIPAYAAGFALYSKRPDTVDENGDVKVGTAVTIKTTFPYKTGYTSNPANSDNDIVLYSVIAHSSIPKYVYLIDGDGDEIEGSRKNFTGDQAVSYDDFIIMPRIDFKKAQLRKDFVKVKGVKWAKGNLVYDVNKAWQSPQAGVDDHFQEGWGLHDEQWKYINWDESKNTAAGRYNQSTELYDHFNWGGIGRLAMYRTGGMIPSTAKFSIVGKVFKGYSSNCDPVNLEVVEGDGRFSSEKDSKGNIILDGKQLGGDVAFWSSNGKYRLPTAAEIKSLAKYNDSASYQLGYITKGGKKIYGYLYTTPLNGDLVQSTEEKELSDADLECGLFLPLAGRRGPIQVIKENEVKVGHSNNNTVIISCNSQGVYRSGVFGSKAVGSHWNSTVVNLLTTKIEYGYTLGSVLDEFAAIFNIKNKTEEEIMAAFKDNTFSNCAGLLIRPVLVEEAAE